MKICHIITRMIVGGAQENTLFTIIDHINKGHEVILITGESLGPEGELLKNKNIPEFETVVNHHLVREMSLYHDFMAYSTLKKFFKKRKIDVVHTHSSKAGVVGRAAAWGAKVPFVCHTVHGQAFHRYEIPIKNFIYKSAERWAAKRCHKIYSVAEAMITQCLDANIAPKEKYKVVYSGMELKPFLESDSPKYEEARCELRKSLGIPKGVPVVSTVARLFPLKGYDYLIEAAKIITKKYPDIHFLIVGDGVLTESIKREAEECGLNFIFSGLVAPSEVYKYIAISDLMIHLSLREGLPRAIVQALASGKPAIGFDLDGTPEVVIHGETGFIAEPENYKEVAKFALDMLDDKKRLIEMGQKGRDLVKKRFDWHIMGDVLEKEYEKNLEFRKKNLEFRS